MQAGGVTLNVDVEPLHEWQVVHQVGLDELRQVARARDARLLQRGQQKIEIVLTIFPVARQKAHASGRRHAFRVQRGYKLRIRTAVGTVGKAAVAER